MDDNSYRDYDIDKPTGGLPAPDATEQHVISIGDLMRMCNMAAERMSVSNPNRLLLMNCAYAMSQMVDRLAKYESKVN